MFRLIWHATLIAFYLNIKTFLITNFYLYYFFFLHCFLFSIYVYCHGFREMKSDVMRTKHLTYSYVTLTNNKLVLIVSTKYWHATRARAFLNQVPSIISDAGHPVTFFSCWLRNYGPALAHHTIILLSTWILLLFFFMVGREAVRVLSLVVFGRQPSYLAKRNIEFFIWE